MNFETLIHSLPILMIACLCGFFSYGRIPTFYNSAFSKCVMSCHKKELVVALEVHEFFAGPSGSFCMDRNVRLGML